MTAEQLIRELRKLDPSSRVVVEYAVPHPHPHFPFPAPPTPPAPPSHPDAPDIHLWIEVVFPRRGWPTRDDHGRLAVRWERAERAMPFAVLVASDGR